MESWEAGANTLIVRGTPWQLWMSDYSQSKLGRASCFTRLLKTEQTFQKGSIDLTATIASNWWRCGFHISTMFSKSTSKILKRPNCWCRSSRLKSLENFYERVLQTIGLISACKNIQNSLCFLLKGQCPVSYIVFEWVWLAVCYKLTLLSCNRRKQSQRR